MKSQNETKMMKMIKRMTKTSTALFGFGLLVLVGNSYAAIQCDVKNDKVRVFSVSAEIYAPEGNEQIIPQLLEDCQFYAKNFQCVLGSEYSEKQTVRTEGEIEFRMVTNQHGVDTHGNEYRSIYKCEQSAIINDIGPLLLVRAKELNNSFAQQSPKKQSSGQTIPQWDRGVK